MGFYLFGYLMAVNVFIGFFYRGKGTGLLSAIGFAAASLNFVTTLKVLAQ